MLRHPVCHFSLWLLPFCLVIPLAWSQEATGPVDQRRELMKTGCMLSYPNGLLDQGHFYGTVSTRYLLLKASKQSELIASRLKLTEEQKLEVKRLVPVGQELERFDPTDEQMVEPKYFDFLEPEQLEVLDKLALRFDGYASLFRVSMAERLELSQESLKAIAAIIDNHRETVVAPLLQNQIAEVRKPKDYDFRILHWSGQFGAMVNIEIVNALKDDECDRLYAFAIGLNELVETMDAIQDLAPLPKGLLAIREALSENER
jgi:hypothetical protein